MTCDVSADSVKASIYFLGHIRPHTGCHQAQRLVLLPQDIRGGKAQLPELEEPVVPWYDGGHRYLDGRVCLLVHLRLQRELLRLVDICNQSDHEVREHAGAVICFRSIGLHLRCHHPADAHSNGKSTLYEPPWYWLNTIRYGDYTYLLAENLGSFSCSC
jgi:hypothetical protein